MSTSTGNQWALYGGAGFIGQHLARIGGLAGKGFVELRACAGPRVFWHRWQTCRGISGRIALDQNKSFIARFLLRKKME